MKKLKSINEDLFQKNEVEKRNQSKIRGGRYTFERRWSGLKPDIFPDAVPTEG